MSWDADITGVHKAIAGSDEHRIGVLAGPGTGKTSYGLMRRVVRLLEAGVLGERILLLSFTRVAAADLRDKVALLEADGVEDVRATTLHGYCLSLLQAQAVLAVTGRKPRILLHHEVDLMLRDVGDGYGTIHDRRRRLEAFTAGWARAVEDHPGVAGDDMDRDFGAAVLWWLRLHEAMLIGEVVPLAYNYLRNNPLSEALVAFDHVIVDEYQDLNRLEQRLLDVLTDEGSLCVAGDDDQSIYSLRYANPEGILEFMGREGIDSYTINQCGRCPANILAMANSLIRQAPGRMKNALTALRETEDGLIALVQWPDVHAEIDGIVAAVADDIGSERREPGQILVLTNWRRIGERIRERLADLEIPVRSFFTEEELAQDEGREGLALLRIAADKRDAPALRVFLGLGDGTGRTAAYQRVLAYCREHGGKPADVLAHLAAGEKLGLAVPSLVKRYREAVALGAELRELELQDLIDVLFPDQHPAVADLRQAALDALPGASSPADLVRALVVAVTQDEVPQNPDFVRIMSLHKSKGLTSDAVYVVGAVDGVLPTLRTDDPATIDAAMNEGRRLFYVAITRAAQELVISGAISLDLADANARGVKYDKRTIRRARDGRFTVRAQSTPYIAELGPSAPRSVAGARWLADRHTD